MNQTRAIHTALKKLMRSRGHTYAQAAVVLDLSEASIKRLFSQQALSLVRLEALCDWLQVDVHDVVSLSREQEPMTTQLSVEQEAKLMSDPGLLPVAHLLLNHWSQEEILETFTFTEPELTRHMFTLQRVGLVEVQPFGRVRLKTARNFSWRKDGPVQTFFVRQVLSEFLSSRFEGQGEAMNFVSGMLSRKSVLHMESRIEELAREMDGLVEGDLALATEKRFGASLCLAFRPWEFSGFTRYRREGKNKEF